MIIGAGQAGLSAGYHLARRGLPFLILEAHPRIGDSWRKRWDSLALFTPARFDALPGMPFPAPRHSFPTKDAMADYLEAYAARFRLPVRTGMNVDRLALQNGRFVVSANGSTLVADNVIVAMSNFQRPRIPAFAADLDPAIRQLHSSEYRNPAQLLDGDVLVVGAGNSGAEIALELARHGRRVLLSGRDTGHLPFRIEGAPARLVLVPFIFRIIFHRVLTTSTPVGRRVRQKLLSEGMPVIRVKPRELVALGVERVERTVGVRDGRPALGTSRISDAANVIWCTGFESDFSWIDVPAFGQHREPIHRRGVAPVPGLYFLGLMFLHAASSAMIHGVGRDADHIARAIRLRAGRPPAG